MPTRIDWLPYGIDERMVALNVIAATIDDYASDLGLTVADVDRIKAIAVEYEFAVKACEQNRIASKAMRIWRDSIISNKRSNKLAGDRPMFNNDAQPPGMKMGLIAEIRRYVRRIKSAAAYTTVTGAALGILTPNHVKTPFNELQPKPKVTAVGGFRVRIACEMKGMDALQVEYQRNGDDKWQKAAFLTKLPETFYIEPAVRGVPESGHLRCFFLKKNKIVGQPSNMPPVTIFGS
jgi:hypothetical protein